MSISKLQASLAQATNEVTVAAANINFDFCLVKYEAPEEYRPLGELLSTRRKESAEHGKSHITARRLAALFEGICTDTPKLIKAYGERVSEISRQATDNEHKSFSSSVFGSYTGVDATSIWAAATSSQSAKTGAIHVHLLACILASMFSATEATSIWVELIEERKKDIAAQWDRDESIPFSVAAAAVQQGIPRNQLAEWDASARAWLQTADSVMVAKQTQLRLILDNVNSEFRVAEESSVYPGVITAWKNTLRTMERLVSGIPQEVHDGSAILGLRAWHIYPNIIVFGSHNIEVSMDDSLVSSGGVLSLGCSPSSTTPTSGVSWSLSLAHLKYYGEPVQRKGVFRSDPTRITFKELLLVVLGCVLSRWNIPIDHNSTWEAIRFLESVSQPFSHILEERHRVKNDTRRANDTDLSDRTKGIHLLSQTATMALGDQDQSLRFINLGRNRSNFLPPLTKVEHVEWQMFLRPFFGLTDVGPLLECFRNPEGRVEFLRRMARRRDLKGRHCIIQYLRVDVYGRDTLNYASVFPRTTAIEEDGERLAKKSSSGHSRWVDPGYRSTGVVAEDIQTNCDPAAYASSEDTIAYECTYLPRTKAEQKLRFWYGDSDVAAIYVDKAPKSPGFDQPKITQQDLLWCAEHGLLSLEKILLHTSDSVTRTLQYLAIASDHTFGTILGPVIQVKILENPLVHTKSMASIGGQTNGARPQISTFTQAISILVYMVAGHDMSHSDVPSNVIGISVGDSIFVPEQLLWDPMKTGVRNSFTRILGNIGKPGCVMFFSVENPVTCPLDASFWRVANPQRFDGVATDLFQNTSMHLSFTDWERPLEGFRSGGNQDVEIALMESVLSIRERGRWIGDVDVLPALRSNIIYRLPPQLPCSHSRTEAPQAHMTSIESWDELREFSAGNVVVRAHRNWIARLAATAYLAQSAERDRRHNIRRITVCPSSVCWKCMDSYVAQHAANIYIY
ncbi:hypothetical protein PG985_010064 [Apiospora marii]|uniref:uncharacterized protein n=1 Tax=Apiospora marii TaxID=335849 RepID=UPI0031327824